MQWRSRSQAFPLGESSDRRAKMRTKMKKVWGKIIKKMIENVRKNEEGGTLAHPVLWGWLRPCCFEICSKVRTNFSAYLELKCLLLIFIYSNQEFKVTCKNADFECRYIRTHTEKETSKISNVTLAILPFSHKNILTKCHPGYSGVYFSWWNHHMCMKVVHSYTKNAKSKVRQSQVYYLRTTRSSALNCEV